MVVSLYWLVLPLVKGKPIKSKGSFQQQQQKTNWTYKNEILQILLRSTHSREEEDEEKEKTFGCLLLFVASSWVTI